ncbi:protein unc h; protein unc g; protein unc f; prot ein unc d; protein unc b [Trichuris trichiura]|uniref:Protein unc h protein unc g protein unc f prot ein unc d protein unc b n=1 Tax=Trichuris trichiura TaxID=36087 RepID=A0A077YYI4_TRITR|nr:protein unc h; protein unc g; protein unc f; prot ein unc d; protein unc b [Trichuris trichiura]
MTIGNPRYNAGSTATTGSTLHSTQSTGDHATGQSESTRPLKRSGSKQRFEIVRKLGSGTYGKVSLAIDHRTGEQVAIKIIKKFAIENAQDLLRIKREIRIMSALRHPNIIEIKEVFENDEKIVIVMEYASGGELYDYVNNFGPLSEAEVRRTFRQIVSAVYFCHKNHVTHRDLKLENILLDKKMNAKIADFGLSNYFSDTDMLRTFCGSPLYASPEIINGIPYRGPEVDCWSLGVLLYSLAYSSMPFDGRDFNRMIRQIKRGIYYEPDNPSSASTLIRIMLRVSTDRRATIDDIANHWWLNFDVEGPPIKDLPENQVNKRRVEPTPGGTAELQVQTFNNENEIFAEFMHLNAATRKRVEEFRKKRKEADAFLSKTRDVAKNVDESTAGGDPFARLQALEQQLHSLSRKPSEKEQQPSKSTKTQSCTPNRESRPIDLQPNSKIELTEEEQTQSAIEQSILAEGNRLANQLVEEQTRGQVSSELIEKIRKTHEQYGIDVLKELLDSVLHSQQTGQETLKGQDIMVDSTHRASSTVQKSDLPDLVKVQARKQPLSQSQTGPDILQQKTKTIPTTQGNNESENDDEEEEEQDVISVEFDDIDDEDNQDKTSSSSKSTLADSIGESLPMESVPPEADGQVELMTSSVSKQTTLNDNDDVSEKSEYSVGLSKRQSRGKYERSKFLFGREIAIEESPRPSRKRVGGVQPEVKDAPALFDKAKKYILQYPDALGSTESMQLVATKQQIIQSIENAPDDQPKATTTTTAEPRQYTDGSGQSKLYKVLWPRASIELEADEDAQSSVQQVNTAETKNELDTFQKGPTSSEQTKDEEMAEEENRATTEILVSQNDEPLAKETEADNGQTLENRYHGVSFGVSQQLQGIQGRAPSRDQATAPTRTSTTAEKSTAFTHQPYDYRRSVYTSPLASTVGRYGDTSAIHGKTDTYRPYISSVYPYFGRSTYRSQLESRDSQEPKSPGAYKQDEKSGTDVLSDYASKFDQRSYGRSRYSSNDYPKRVATHESSSHHYVASRSGGNRSHSLYELSVPAKRFSIAYAAPSSGAGETDLRLSYDQPRRRARSLYDTTDSSGHTDYYYAPKIRDSTALSYSSAAAEKPMTSTNYGKSSNDKYNFRTDDNITYRRSLYDVENDIGGSGVSALQRYHQGSGRGLAKARAQSLDKYTSDGLATDTNTYFSTVSKPYVYPVYGHTVYQETAGNSMQDYPKSPPDASVQPIKGILKKKPVSSTSSTPTDDDSGYSSVPAADSHITGGSRTDKAIKGSSYLNWRAKSPSKTFNIMERIRRRINNNEREGGATVDTDVGGSITNYKSSSILDDRPVSSTGTISAATKYSKWSGPQSTTTSYLSSSNSPMKEKEVSALESLEKNQKPRKKRNLWNLGRRRTVELPFQSSASSNEDSAYFKRPSSPLEKLKGFFVSTTTPATDSSKSRSFGYPSSSSSSVSSKLKDRSSYSPLDAPSGYTSAGNAVSYRKFTKVGAVRPHSSYGSTTHSWYEDNPLY